MEKRVLFFRGKKENLKISEYNFFFFRNKSLGKTFFKPARSELFFEFNTLTFRLRVFISFSLKFSNFNFRLQLGMDGEELTEQETALYDRQIRVWGADAQRRY